MYRQKGERKMAYMTHAYNSSPILRGVTGEAITQPAMRAVRFDDGKLVLCKEGENAVGIAIATMDDKKAGDDLDYQIKDCCYWITGDTLQAGDELASDANGCAVKAQTGQYVIAMALETVPDAGKPVLAHVHRTGIKPATT